MTRIRPWLLPLTTAFCLFASGCDRKTDDSPLAVSMIGAPPAVANPNAGPLDPTEATLIAATAQGLVRYDAQGQIEPGLAIRWAISEDGLYYTFRLADIAGLDADMVARHLRAVIARHSDNPIKPILGAVDEIVAVTPAVVEIRLKAARPNLLDLLARPELAIVDRKISTGPLTIARGEKSSILLQPTPPTDGDEPPEPSELKRQSVLLRGERTALAVARFMAGRADLVLNGRLTDFAIARASRPRPRDLRFDGVSGLFGLKAVERTGFIGNSENRRALAMAVDRDRIGSAFGIASLQPTTTLVAPGTAELPQAAQPGWSTDDLATRRVAASATVRLWRQAHPDQDARVRVALPDSPGSKLLFVLLRSDWAAIGVEAERVGMNGDADLRLIDEVAPAQTATWYLRHFTCDRSTVCSDAADRALDLARAAAHPVERAARIADADLRLAELVPYIPLAQPVRWSLVGARAVGFVTNNRGVHPLYHLVEETR